VCVSTQDYSLEVLPGHTPATHPRQLHRVSCSLSTELLRAHSALLVLLAVDCDQRA
jgi:hypothetical protein